jgi:hypothetical protein
MCSSVTRTISTRTPGASTPQLTTSLRSSIASSRAGSSLITRKVYSRGIVIHREVSTTPSWRYVLRSKWISRPTSPSATNTPIVTRPEPPVSTRTFLSGMVSTMTVTSWPPRCTGDRADRHPKTHPRSRSPRTPGRRHPRLGCWGPSSLSPTPSVPLPDSGSPRNSYLH